MRATIDAKVLSAELDLVGRAAAKKPAIPITACIRITADSADRLRFAATDLDVTMLSSAPAEVSKQGAVVVPAEQFSALARSHNGPVTLEAQENLWLKVTCGRSSAKLPGLDPQDYPTLPDPPPNGGVTVDAARWLSMLRSVLFVARRNNGTASQWHLCGVHATAKGGKVRMIAGDGHSCAMVEKPMDTSGEEGVGVIPNRQAELLLAMDGRDASTLRWTVGERQMLFEYGDAVLAGPRLEGSFPSMERILTMGEGYKTGGVSVALLSSALKRIAAVNPEGAAEFDIKPGAIALLAESADKGRIEDEIEATFTKECGPAMLNRKYVSEFLATLDCDTVDLSIGASEQPVYWQADGTRYIVAVVRK